MKDKLMKTKSLNSKSTPLSLTPQAFFDAIDIVVNYNNDARLNDSNPACYVNKIPLKGPDSPSNRYRNRTAAAGIILQNLSSHHFFALASNKFQSVPQWLADLMLIKIKEITVLKDDNGYDILGYDLSYLPYFYQSLLLTKEAYQSTIDPSNEYTSMKGLHSFVSTEFKYYSMMNTIGATAKPAPLLLSHDINNQFKRLQSFDDFKDLVFFLLTPLIQRFAMVYNVLSFKQPTTIYLRSDKKSIILAYDKSVFDLLSAKFRAYLFVFLLNFNSIAQFDPLSCGLSLGFTIKFADIRVFDLKKYSSIGNVF